MDVTIFSRSRSSFSKLRYEQRTIIVFLCLLIVVVFSIWGVHSRNFTKVVEYVEKPVSSTSPFFSNRTFAFLTSSNIKTNNKDQTINGVNLIKKDKTINKKKVKTFAPILPTQTNPFFSKYPIWFQNFKNYNDSHLNTSFWNVYQGPPPNANNESEYYTGSSNNLRVSNGNLTLEATQNSEPDNFHYASARIDTKNKKSFLYGRIDVVAKVPNGVGTWPAVWMLPATTKYNNNPSTSSYGGEMDLVEEVGFNPNIEYGIVHTESDILNSGVGKYNTIYIPNNDKFYNLYTLLWTPSSITFEINNAPFFTYSKTSGANYTTWPFSQSYYLILNLALGGTWGGQDILSFPSGIDNSALPASMQIQSIYYYPYIGPR